MASIRKNPPAPEPEHDVCLHLSARPSEQQPGPVSDVHGLVPLAALPHQHWHHVLHVRVVPGRGRRWAWGWRWGRCGGWGREPGHPHGEPRTVAAGRGEESRRRAGMKPALKSSEICHLLVKRIFFHAGVFAGAKGTQLLSGCGGAGLRGDCNTLMFATQAVRRDAGVFIKSFFSVFFREMMSQKRTAPPHLTEKVTFHPWSPPLYLMLSGHVISYYWHIMEDLVVAHIPFWNMAELWQPIQIRGTKRQTLSSRWGSPFRNARNVGWDHHSMQAHTVCVYQNPGQLWKYWNNCS